MKAVLDKAGRIVLPKSLRDEFHLETGDTFEIKNSGEDITLRPVRGQAQLRKKHGIWVYRAGEPLSAATVENTIRQIRSERDAQNVGPGKKRGCESAFICGKSNFPCQALFFCGLRLLVALSFFD